MNWILKNNQIITNLLKMEIDSFLKSPVVIDNVIRYNYLREAAIWKSVLVVSRKNPIFSQQCKIDLIDRVGRPKYDVVIPNTNNQFQHYMGDDLAP